MLLRNHGTLTVGENVGEAFVRMYFLERACEAQILALSAGEGNLNNPPQGSPELTAQQGKIGLKLAAGALAWPALLRKAYRLDPGFATGSAASRKGKGPRRRRRGPPPVDRTLRLEAEAAGDSEGPRLGQEGGEDLPPARELRIDERRRRGARLEG